MGTKANPGTFDCYAAMPDDEPHFILRAVDHAHVRQWAHERFHLIMSGQKPNTPEAVAKIFEALKVAAAMQDYHFEHVLRPAHDAQMAQAKANVAQQLEDMGVDVKRALPEILPDKKAKPH